MIRDAWQAMCAGCVAATANDPYEGYGAINRTH